MTQAPLIRTVWETNAVLGEGPIWSIHHNGLFWVDIKRPALHLWSPEENTKSTWPLPAMIGCVAIQPGGQIIAALEDGIYDLDLPLPGQTPRTHLIAKPGQHAANMRFNDGKLAPDGTLWAGTMDNEEKAATGAWYRLAPDNSLQEMSTGFMVTNGPAFDETRNRIYLNDSARQTTYMASMDASSPLELTPFKQFSPDDGYPDGMTVGADGTLWVAFWDGWCVRGLNPETGDVLHTIKMPVPRPTSCALIPGDDTRLYVTSASIGLLPEEMAAAPLSGSLFEVSLVG